MASWLETYAPRRFDELAMDESIRTNLERVSIQANPPHLILAGPAGVGKTAAWRLVARQILGPSWQSTTHILQARDLAKTAGAMKNSKISCDQKALLQAILWQVAPLSTLLMLILL